jgi:N-hydroxyarylamine O-acetyltransferase
VDGAVVEAYLARIGADRPPVPDAGALRELQLRHLRTVPFENLSVHLGEEIVLAPEALVAKLVDRQRGGFCYELNGAFAALLTALGYRVTMLAARVFTPVGLGPLFDHLALRVAPGADDQQWLVDVGFGSFSRYPIRLDPGAGEQSDPEGTFQVVARDEGDLDVLWDGEPEYRLETRPRVLADFAPTCWWHRTSPESNFTRSLTCSRLTETGRITLSGRRLIRTTTGAAGDRHEQTLASDADVLSTYRTQFGITLDRVPQVGSNHPSGDLRGPGTLSASAGASRSRREDEH